MIRRIVPLLALALWAVPASAQVHLPTPERSHWTVVRVAKWALLGAAVGFGTYALSASRSASHAYAQLDRLCHSDQSKCAQNPNGSYVDADAEGLYDRAVSRDRQARVGILGGQVTLLGSAALFIYDLRNQPGPGTIPYPTGGGARGRRIVVGARLPF